MTQVDAEREAERGGPRASRAKGSWRRRLRLAVLQALAPAPPAAGGEVTQSQVSVLSSVERLGNPTLGELAASEKVQPPSMTRQVDALVGRGCSRARCTRATVASCGSGSRQAGERILAEEPFGPHGVRGGEVEAPAGSGA